MVKVVTDEPDQKIGVASRAHQAVGAQDNAIVSGDVTHQLGDLASVFTALVNGASTPRRRHVIEG
jgi:hypothetical protein